VAPSFANIVDGCDMEHLLERWQLSEAHWFIGSATFGRLCNPAQSHGHPHPIGLSQLLERELREIPECLPQRRMAVKISAETTDTKRPSHL